MTPQELKNSILQLAIQGKLVEQRPEEGTGEELYRQIQQEKQKLVKAGKIKKEKPLPEVAEEEKLFEIPENWIWVHIGDLFQHNTGKALNTTNTTGTLYSYITTSNVYWNCFDLDELKAMHFTESELERCTIQKGDLLVLEGGDIGRAAIWNNDFPMRIQNHIHRLRPYGTVYIEFFYYLFFLYKSTGLINGKGIGIKGLSTGALHSLIAPLPPFAEQKRIVCKIVELLPYIDRYEQAWESLEAFNTRFPDDMRKSLLQLAIQGKLVEQRPEEGTGEELYRQIQQEKQKLIKEGKLKKEKLLPEIAENEKPFEIPESWKWVRVAEICRISTGNKDANYGVVGGEYPFFTCAARPIRCPGFSFDGEAVLLAGNGDFNNISFFRGKFEAYQRTYVVMPFNGISLEYLYYAFCARWVKYNMDKIYGSAIPYIRLKNVQEYLIPVPPLAEQKRVVAKLEQLLPLCEKLKQCK